MSPLTVGVIGAGRVGAVLGAALAAAGHRVVAAAGVSAAAKTRIARLLPDAANLPADQVARAATDLLIISVPDDALAGVVAGLASRGTCDASKGASRGTCDASKGASRGTCDASKGASTSVLTFPPPSSPAGPPTFLPGQVVAHTSGAHGLAVLAPVTASGARPLALHPAMTFTGRREDLRRLAGTSFGVTAPDDLRPFATRLVAAVGGSIEWVAEDDRPLYHAALAHGANHLVTLVNEALDRLRDAGVAHPEKVLGPLLEAALRNALDLGDAALTGPVSRGDAGTVAQHLDRLAAIAPESVPPYLALARRTADRAIASGRLRPMDAERLLDVLASRTEMPV